MFKINKEEVEYFGLSDTRYSAKRNKRDGNVDTFYSAKKRYAAAKRD